VIIPIGDINSTNVTYVIWVLEYGVLTVDPKRKPWIRRESYVWTEELQIT